MKIEKPATVGTLESSDLMVKVEPNTGIEVVINSQVGKQFGKQIQSVVDQTIKELGLTDGLIIIDDKGALDCAIRARIQCAILRGTNIQTLDWSKLL